MNQNIVQIKMSIILWCFMKGQWTMKVIAVHPEGDVNLCTQFEISLPSNNIITVSRETLTWMSAS